MNLGRGVNAGSAAEKDLFVPPHASWTRVIGEDQLLAIRTYQIPANALFDTPSGANQAPSG